MLNQQKPAEEATRDKLKKALNTLGNTILQDVKKILYSLEELNKSGRRSKEQREFIKEYMPTLKEYMSGDFSKLELVKPFPYLQEIASNITPPKAFYSMLKDIDNYCFTLGIPLIRFIYQSENEEVELGTLQLIVNAVDKEYGESHCNALEVEKIFREEILNQLMLYNDRIEKEKNKLNPAEKCEKVAGTGKEGIWAKIRYHWKLISGILTFIIGTITSIIVYIEKITTILKFVFSFFKFSG